MLENYSIHGCYKNVLWNWIHSNACSSFWLTTYIPYACWTFFSSANRYCFGCQLCSSLDPTKYMWYVYVCAMYVDRAVEKNNKYCSKSSANACTCMLELQENENIIYFFYMKYTGLSIIELYSHLDHRIVRSIRNGWFPCIYDPWYSPPLKFRFLIKTSNSFEI